MSLNVSVIIAIIFRFNNAKLKSSQISPERLVIMSSSFFWPNITEEWIQSLPPKSHLRHYSLTLFTVLQLLWNYSPLKVHKALAMWRSVPVVLVALWLVTIETDLLWMGYFFFQKELTIMGCCLWCSQNI